MTSVSQQAGTICSYSDSHVALDAVYLWITATIVAQNALRSRRDRTILCQIKIRIPEGNICWPKKISVIIKENSFEKTYL